MFGLDDIILIRQTFAIHRKFTKVKQLCLNYYIIKFILNNIKFIIILNYYIEKFKNLPQKLKNLKIVKKIRSICIFFFL